MLTRSMVAASISAMEMAKRHDRVRRVCAGKHRHESDVQDRASGPQSDDGDVVSVGGCPKLVNDGLDHGVGRDRSRQRRHDAAEALRLRIATLDLDTGGPGVQDRRRNEDGNCGRQGQFGRTAVGDEELHQPLAHQEGHRDPEQHPGQKDSRRPCSPALIAGILKVEPGGKVGQPHPDSSTEVSEGPVRRPAASHEGLHTLPARHKSGLNRAR